MATSATDGRAVDTTGAASKGPPSSQHSGKPSFAARMTESTRKADDDASGQARRGAPRAWTSGMNPITQRHPSSSPQPNGTNSRANASSEKAASDRQAWVYGNAVGLECKFIMKTGHAFTGVLIAVHKLSNDDRLVLKMVKHSTSNNTDETVNPTYAGYGAEHKMVVLASSMSTFEVPQAPPVLKPHTTNGGFRTDADISGGNQAFRERVLQRWEAGPADTSVDLSLESSTGGWDQFKVNETRFGVKSDYDENLYTTQIDRKNPLYAMREREAERIAREIESQTSTNAHIREERGIIDDGDDEEERYSGVRRDFAALQSTQPNRYIPPSRRNQTSTEIAAAPSPPKDAHIDPAIISSQIARSAEANNPKAEQSTTADKPPAPAPEISAGNSTESYSPAAASKDAKRTRQASKPSGVVAANNIEQKVLDSFHQFSASEKIKVQVQKRSRASADKAVKINDLLKFSQNFRLLTPVPKDLVPILAKDEGKQKEIIQKAQQAAESSHSSKIATFIDTPKPVRQPPSGRWEVDTAAAAAGSQRDRSRQTSVPQSALPSDRPQHPQIGPGSLSAKLSDHHRAHKAGTHVPIQSPIMMNEPRRDSRGSMQTSGLSSPQKPPSIRGSSTISGAKLNVKAMEFKPTAVPFKPGSSTTTVIASSPRSGPTTRTISPTVISIKFFTDQATFANRKSRPTPASIAKQKSTETTQEPMSEGPTKTSAPSIPPLQGGFQFPYRTAPTWTHSENADNQVDYKAVFAERRPRRFNGPHPHASPGMGMQPHFPIAGHLPQGTHGMPHVQAPHQNLHQMHQQPAYGHPQNFEDSHMRPSPSNSSHFPAPSPRMQQQNMAYASPMPGHAHMAYPPHMQYPMQTPPMGGRQFSNGPGMGPMQGGHLAPMMVQHHSAGGLLPQQMGMPYNGQLPMYASPVPTPAMYGSPNQQSSGFPSPGRTAPMMMHQSSQQGQQPMYMPATQYGQPMYPQQSTGHMGMRPAFGSPQLPYAHHPYPPHQYPQQVHRTPSQGYARPHHTPQPQHATPQQVPPSSAPSTEVGEEVK